MSEAAAVDECYSSQLVQLNCNNYPSVKRTPNSNFRLKPELLMFSFFLQQFVNHDQKAEMNRISGGRCEFQIGVWEAWLNVKSVFHIPPITQTKTINIELK